jgi:hypothetical protein
MHALAQAAVAGIWHQASQVRTLFTPDHALGRAFRITRASEADVTIETTGGSTIVVTREAIVAVVAYLAGHGHTINNPCEIRSHQHTNEAGALCVVARDQNHGTRVINYIVPILASVGLVAVNSGRPNTVWLL